MLKNMSREQIVRWTAQYMLVASILSLCYGSALIGLGGIGGFASFILADSLFMHESIIVSLVGVIALILFPLMIVAAVGLFRRAPWSRQAVIYVAGLDALTWLLFLLFSGGVFDLVWLLVSGFFAYFYYSDPGIRQVLSGTQMDKASTG
jgi:hypothetical protein